MQSKLPSIEALNSVDTKVWIEFGDILRGTGYGEDFLKKFWLSSWKIYKSLQKPVNIQRAQKLNSDEAIISRLFNLRDSIARKDVVSVFGNVLTESLIISGLLQEDNDGISSSFMLTPFDDLIILCDDVLHGGDAVFGRGPGTAALTALSPKKGDKCLDLGCGAGLVALNMGKIADTVVAIDINQRAIDFLIINQHINEIYNIEPKLGSWFEPIENELFDLILSQPPFVTSPDHIDACKFKYGGDFGYEFAYQIMKKVPCYLTNEGRASIIFELPFKRDKEILGSFNLNEDHGYQNLLITGGAIDIDHYSIRFAESELIRSIFNYDLCVTKMWTHLLELGVEYICPAVCLINKVKSGINWTEQIATNYDIWDKIRTIDINKLFGGITQCLEMGKNKNDLMIKIPLNSSVLEIQTVSSIEPSKYILVLPSCKFVHDTLEFTKAEWMFIREHANDNPVEGGLEVVIPSYKINMYKDVLTRILKNGLIWDYAK